MASIINDKVADDAEMEQDFAAEMDFKDKVNDLESLIETKMSRLHVTEQRESSPASSCRSSHASCPRGGGFSLPKLTLPRFNGDFLSR